MNIAKVLVLCNELQHLCTKGLHHGFELNELSRCEEIVTLLSLEVRSCKNAAEVQCNNSVVNLGNSSGSNNGRSTPTNSFLQDNDSTLPTLALVASAFASPPKRYHSAFQPLAPTRKASTDNGKESHNGVLLQDPANSVFNLTPLVVGGNHKVSTETEVKSPCSSSISLDAQKLSQPLSTPPLNSRYSRLWNLPPYNFSSFKFPVSYQFHEIDCATLAAKNDTAISTSTTHVTTLPKTPGMTEIKITGQEELPLPLVGRAAEAIKSSDLQSSKSSAVSKKRSREASETTSDKTSTDTDTEEPPPKRKRGRKKLNKENLVCQNCHVTETPEWRRGPSGPATLCNACGIRYATKIRKLEARMCEAIAENKRRLTDLIGSHTPQCTPLQSLQQT